MRRILFASTLIGLMLLFSVSALWAQDAQTSVTTIPVESKASMVKLSPDDHTLAVYNNYVIYDEAPTADLTRITLIDLESGDPIDTLSGYSDWVTDVAFNADGSRLVSFHRNGDLLVWDMNSKTLIKTIPTYTIGGSWVQFLNDDKTVLFRAGELVIGMLDTESGAITHLFGQHIDTYAEYSETYTQFPARGDITFVAAAVSPDGQWLVFSTANDEVILWNIATGNQRTLREKSEKFGLFSIRSFVFSQDGSQLAYFDQVDKKTHLWDVAKRGEIGAYDVGGLSFALAPDGKTIAWADRESNTVYLADTTSSDAPTTLVELPERMKVSPLTSLAFTSDGKQVVVGGLFAEDGDNQITVVNLAS
ncbi:MAG: hypothetical protein ABI835_21535 [Chloroflexota bacterium]